MKFKNPIQPLALPAIALLVLAFPSPSPARQPQTGQETPSPSIEEARGAFIKNRNKTSNPASNTTPSAAQQQPQQAQAGSSKPLPPAGNRRRKRLPQPPSAASTAIAGTIAGGPAPVAKPAPVPIGVGFTLYQRNDRGDAIRVNPTMTFHKDDSVRFVIEPNIDGYLYIFYSEDEAEPVMIFPDHRLHEGDNKIIAHVPYEVPSRHSKTPWFVFDEKPAVENLLIVVTKTPLDGVLVGVGLVKHCLPFGEDCIWKPSKPQYDLVTRESAQPKIVSLSKTLGQVLAAAEEVAIAKGIKLRSQEPEPTIVQMNVKAALDILVMKTQLIHR